MTKTNQDKNPEDKPRQKQTQQRETQEMGLTKIGAPPWAKIGASQLHHIVRRTVLKMSTSLSFEMAKK